jgi:hypothetical protein
MAEARRRLVVRPKTTVYDVEREEGDTEVEVVVMPLVAYYQGDRCPVPVSIEVQDAWKRWEEETQIILVNEETGEEEKKYNGDMQSDMRLRRDVLRAVIPGLEENEANVLAANGGQWRDILIELGWWVASNEEEPPGGQPEGEAERGEDSTSADSSPDLASISLVSTS